MMELLGKTVSGWGETPLYAGKRVYWIDARARRIHILDWESGGEAYCELPFAPGCIVAGNRRERGWVELFAAGQGGFYRVALGLDPEDVLPVGEPIRLEQVVVEALGNPLPEGLAFNDGKCSPDGRFFAGSIDPKRQPSGGIWRLDTDLSLSFVYGPVRNSNGLVWSADGNLVYHIDTPLREVAVFDYRDGEFLNRRIAFSTARIDASPDGMAIDDAGNLWIAFCHAGLVVCYQTDGTELAEFSLPCREVTACCFAGEAMNRLVVTSGVPADEIEPLAGRLFVSGELGVQGRQFSSFGG